MQAEDDLFIRRSNLEQMRDPLDAAWNRSLASPCSSKEVVAATDLAAMIDFRLMNTIFENFLEVVGLPVAIIDLEGRVLASSRWQALCAEFHRADQRTLARCQESDIKLSANLAEGEYFTIYSCRNGLTDCAAPIIVDDVHVANLFIGQFFLSPPDMDYFRRQREEFAFDNDAYFKALAEVPIVSAVKLPAILRLMGGIAQGIARQCLAVQRARATQGAAEKLVTERTRELAASHALLAARLRLVELSPACSLHDLLVATLDEVCALTKAEIGFYHFLEADQTALSLQAWSTKTTRAFCRVSSQPRHYNLDGAGVWADCVRLKRSVVCNDYPSLAGRRGLPEGHAEVRNFISVPIIREGQSVAIFGVGNKVTPFDENDLVTVETLADLAWDLAARKRAEEEARAANERAEAAHRSKATFFASASHDLRQPYQAMRLFWMVAETEAATLGNERLRSALRRLGHAMDASEELLNALLDVATLEAGRVVPHVTDFPINDIIAAEEENFLRLAQAHGLGLRSVPTEAWVRSDPVLLRRILRNLLTNAVKYTDKGGVLIGCRRRGDHLLVQVWDTGKGIAPDQQAAIFDDFYQVDNPARSRSEGHGLGLSVVARTAKTLGHEIKLRSTLGRGSVFTVVVPLALLPA